MMGDHPRLASVDQLVSHSEWCAIKIVALINQLLAVLPIQFRRREILHPAVGRFNEVRVLAFNEFNGVTNQIDCPSLALVHDHLPTRTVAHGLIRQTLQPGVIHRNSHLVVSLIRRWVAAP